MERPEDGMITFQLPASLLWNNLKKFFLAKWTMEMEDIQSLLKELEGIRQAESEIVRDFGLGSRSHFTRFLKAIVLKTSTSFTSILMDFRYI
jgi:hypothetical protein